jgi:peptidoglycan-N-acetylglucosamine deacetylase
MNRGAAGRTARAMPPVALTFDDGPDPVWTPRVLDALAAAAARATFFVMAPRVAAHPATLAAALAAGHDVELHCGAHVRHTDAGRAAVEADTREALAVLGAHGVQPRRWRPPWGVRAEWSGAVAAAHGLELVGWTADPHDWRGDAAGTMLKAIAPRLAPGAVVLLHDGIGPGARRDGCAETVRLVPRLVAHLRGRGLEPGPLGREAVPCPA